MSVRPEFIEVWPQFTHVNAQTSCDAHGVSLIWPLPMYIGVHQMRLDADLQGGSPYRLSSLSQVFMQCARIHNFSSPVQIVLLVVPLLNGKNQRHGASPLEIFEPDRQKPVHSKVIIHEGRGLKSTQRGKNA
jgi:hypothetical protein